MAKSKNTSQSRNAKKTPAKRKRASTGKTTANKTDAKSKSARSNKRASSPKISRGKRTTTTEPKRSGQIRTTAAQRASADTKPQDTALKKETSANVTAPLPSEEKINIKLDQSVAILIDGNNIEMSLHTVSKSAASMINFDKLVPALLQNRSLSRLIYFREGKSISQKLADRLQKLFHGSVVPCYKSADIPLSIKAVQVASKVDTIIILSGDADYVELVRHLKHDGIRVEIAAFPETSAEILLSEADYFFPITTDYSFALK